MTDTTTEAVENLAQLADAWGEVNLAQYRDEQSNAMALISRCLRALAAERDALMTQVTGLEKKRDEYHQIANAYCAWINDVAELLEDRRDELDPDSPSDERLLALLDLAEQGIARQVRAALLGATPLNERSEERDKTDD